MADSRIDTERAAVSGHVLELLQSLTQDTDIGPITLDTRLSDTGLDSVCVAYLIGEVQQYYELHDALYRALVTANVPILSLQVSRLVDSICELLPPNGRTEKRGTNAGL